MYNQLILPDLRQMLQENDETGLTEFCQIFHPAETAEILEGLPTDEIWRVLAHAPLERQVEIFEFMSLAQQMQMVEAVDRERLSKLIEGMSADDRVDLLSRMDSDHVERLLPLIAKAERVEIRKLLSYPDECAGSIMTTEYASLPEGITVRDALERLRHQAPDRETIYYIYILDDERHLRGFISLRDLILAKPSTKLADIMTRDVIFVRVDDDQEHVAQQMSRYDFIAMPVVDNASRLVGIITHDDILDVLAEEATEDAHRQGAVEPLEDSYLETPLLIIAWKRGVWLLLLLVTAFFTFSVLNYYEGVSVEFKWLIAFLPLVLASGGNAGSQSATLVIRALALGEFRHDSRSGVLRVTRRELITGFLLGGAIAVLGFLFAALVRSPVEAAVVGVTLALVISFGTVNGALLPILLRYFKGDPALMSNPLIASLSDILGVVVYYNVAMLLLR